MVGQYTVDCVADKAVVICANAIVSVNRIYVCRSNSEQCRVAVIRGKSKGRVAIFVRGCGVERVTVGRNAYPISVGKVEAESIAYANQSAVGNGNVSCYRIQATLSTVKETTCESDCCSFANVCAGGIRRFAVGVCPLGIAVAI